MSREPDFRLEVAGLELCLLPGRAIFLPEWRTLLVADLHVGKATSFRQLGVPVPSGTTQDTLTRLSELVTAQRADRVVILGDFLHSARSLAADTFATLQAWRERHADLEIVLVRGNHDRHAGDPPDRLRIETVAEPFIVEGLALMHHPKAQPGAFVLAGHLHPCVSLGARAHDRHRLPCFWFTPEIGVLPAFGAFTGMHEIRARPGERVFAIAPERVMEVPHLARRPRHSPRGAG